MTILSRLLNHPNRQVFSADPSAELALRIRHPSGATWSIADDVLTASAGSTQVSLDLLDHTVASLADALETAGFEVAFLSPTWASRPALALVEGSGDQARSNGDHVLAFTSIFWALYVAQAGAFREAEYQIGQALRQMVIPQAEGEWLDVWGALYGVARAARSDATYAPFITAEVTRLRVNAYAIEKAIRDLTGWDVRIEEPWRELFRLDESTLSGGFRFYDGDHVGYHLIRPEALDNDVDWSVVLPIVERNKPAGVIVVDWRIKPTITHQDVVTYTSQKWRRARRTWLSAQSTWKGMAPVVDVMHTSIGEPVVLNETTIIL